MTAEIVTDKNMLEELRNRPQWKVTMDKNPGHSRKIAENLRSSL